MKTVLAISVTLLAIESSSPYAPLVLGVKRQQNLSHLLAEKPRRDDSSSLEEWTTPQLLRALDQRSIRYPATATRQELQAVLIQEMYKKREDEQSPPNVDVNLQARYRKRRQRRNSNNYSHPTDNDSNPVEQLWNPLVSASSEILNTGYRQARRLKRRVSDAWAVDPTTGVRTVRYTKTRPAERPTTPRRGNDRDGDMHSESQWKRNNGVGDPIEMDVPRGRTRHRRRSTAARSSHPPPIDPRESVSRPSIKRNRNINNITATDPSSSGAIILASSVVPRNDGGPSRQQPTQRHRRHRRNQQQRQRRSHDPNKKIYSVYGPNNNDAPEAVAAWMTEAADRVWNDNRTGEQRHWKDALGERVDQLLGLEDYETGDRPRGAAACGTSRRPRRKTQKRASLFALITGRSIDGRNNRGRSSSLDSLLENVWATGSMLSIGKLVIWTGARYFGLACRWASVRGAVPQPIVALVVGSVALSARQRRLWWTALTLCVLRAVGEAVTEAQGGSSYSGSYQQRGTEEEDWEDDSAQIDTDEDEDEDEDLVMD